jgi:hypothetical protein
MEFILKQMKNIVFNTPIGCAEKMSDFLGFKFFNSQTMSKDYRKMYEVFLTRT